MQCKINIIWNIKSYSHLSRGSLFKTEAKFKRDLEDSSRFQNFYVLLGMGCTVTSFKWKLNEELNFLFKYKFWEEFLHRQGVYDLEKMSQL